MKTVMTNAVKTIAAATPATIAVEDDGCELSVLGLSVVAVGVGALTVDDGSTKCVLNVSLFTGVVDTMRLLYIGSSLLVGVGATVVGTGSTKTSKEVKQQK